MAVMVEFGMTQSGKSYFAENQLLVQKKRVVIFDKACCFKIPPGRGFLFINPDDEKIKKIFREFMHQDELYLIFRPDRSTDIEKMFNKVTELACALGRVGKLKGEWLTFVVDEADFVCSERHQSRQLKHLVNVGRHDFVDSVFIARNPNRIHTDIRANASKMVCFRIPNARSITFFQQNFTPKTIEKIANLPKYWRLDWDDTGTERIIDDKGRIQSELLPNLEMFNTTSRKKNEGNGKKAKRNF